MCVVREESSWRAAGSSVKLRSDPEMFVPASVQTCWNNRPDPPSQAKTETRPVGVTCYVLSLFVLLGNYCYLFFVNSFVKSRFTN